MRNRTHLLWIAATVGAMAVGARLSDEFGVAVAAVGHAYASLPGTALLLAGLGGIAWSIVSVVWTDVPCPLTVDLVVLWVLGDGAYRLLSEAGLWVDVFYLQFAALAVVVVGFYVWAMLSLGGRLVAVVDPEPTELERELLDLDDPYGDRHAARILDDED